MVLTVLALAGCGTDERSDVCTPPLVRNVDPGDPILEAPDTVEVDGRSYVLSAYLWRDFIPHGVPDGRPLQATVRLRSLDGLAIPDSLEGHTVQVMHGTLLWSAMLAPGTVDSTAGAREWTADCGPKWGPGVEADVIAHFVTGTQPDHMVVARGVTIARTD